MLINVNQKECVPRCRYTPHRKFAVGLNKQHRFMEQIKDIKQPSKWLMQQQPGDIDMGRLPERHSDLSLSVMIARYNKRYGEQRNIFIHYHYNKDTQVIVLVSETWEEYLNGKEAEYDKRAWRRKIPREFL